jgi:hypothetical protein
MMTRSDIRKVMKVVPELTSHGIGIYDDGRGKTAAERKEQWARDKAELLGSAAICTKVVEWLTRFTPTKTINRQRSSYGLKHIAEAALGEYVGNGQFIAAAIYAGFEYVIHPGYPNVYFNISERSLNQEIERIKTTTGRLPV